MANERPRSPATQMREAKEAREQRMRRQQAEKVAGRNRKTRQSKTPLTRMKYIWTKVAGHGYAADKVMCTHLSLLENAESLPTQPNFTGHTLSPNHSSVKATRCSSERSCIAGNLQS